MKTSIRRTALTSLAILFLLGGTNAAFASTPTSQLNASFSGYVTTLGTQIYNVSGGQVLGVMIGSTSYDPSTFNIQFSLTATQNGFSTNGYANVQISGTAGGMPVGVSGNFNVGSSVAGGYVPYDCPGAEACTGAIPLFFVGSSSNVAVTYGTTTREADSVYIESPYFNPGQGAAIVISTGDGMTIVATYSQATVIWSGAQTAGVITGTLGSGSTSQPVSGNFQITTYEYENLVTGIAKDAGTIQFSSMTPSSLNAKGIYTGSDTIPTNTATDCSGYYQLPEGTCYFTGFNSNGNFRMNGISGSYVTTWTVPAIFIGSSTVTAQVSQPGSSGNFGSFFLSLFRHF